MNLDLAQKLYTKWRKTGMFHGLHDSLSEYCLAYNLESGANFLINSMDCDREITKAEDEFNGFFLIYIRRLHDNYPHVIFDWTLLGPIVRFLFIEFWDEMTERIEVIKKQKMAFRCEDIYYEVMATYANPRIGFNEYALAEDDGDVLNGSGDANHN